MYYRGAAAAIVVYDITNPDSFAGAKSWVKELQRRGDPNVVIALAGNKADLESRRKVPFEEANAYAEENGILHMETSAKNANNVKSLFVEIAKTLPKDPQEPEREAFPITPPTEETRNCCSSCSRLQCRGSVVCGLCCWNGPMECVKTTNSKASNFGRSWDAGVGLF